LEPLCRWPSKLEQFNEQLQSSHLEKNTGAPILSDSTDGAAESRKTVIAFSKIEGQTLQDKTTKNLQAMAAGLAWILEVISAGLTYLVLNRILPISHGLDFLIGSDFGSTYEQVELKGSGVICGTKKILFKNVQKLPSLLV
jgi:hypothetical protein